MDVGAFDFALPEERIALRPAEPRDAARLLRVDARDGLSDHIVRDLPGLLRPGDLLVFNDTRVIPAQLQGIRERDGASVAVSATLVERLDEATWWVLARPGRRLKLGDRIRFGFDGNACLAGRLDATVRTKDMDGRAQLAFDLAGPALDEAIRQAGRPPLPPYIAARRAADARDADDYQTVYAREDGAVAAPTAGLHFTPELLAMLELAGVESAFLTLHVGAGTFAPMKAERTEDHVMHAEHGEVTPAAAERIDAARARGGRVVAVGTTSLRLLETATAPDGVTHPFAGRTDIFITPGYRFRGADALMTNFHLPRSTLFMLVAAFCGLETMRRAYAHAIEAGYRFYSYGDASLLFPASLE